MDYFEKAFKRQRNNQYIRGGRKLSDLEKLTKNPPQYLYYYNAAQESYSNGNYLNGLAMINDAIELSDIDDWKQYAFKANILEDLQKYNEAIQQYELAIDISESDVFVYALYHQIGVCYLSLGLNEKAVEFYTYAIELKKNHPNNGFNLDLEGMNSGTMMGIEFKKMYNNRGNALSNIGQLHQAFSDAKTSLSYDENYSNPYILISLICSKYGQEDKSVEFLQIAASLGNENAKRMLSQLGY